MVAELPFTEAALQTAAARHTYNDPRHLPATTPFGLESQAFALALFILVLIAATVDWWTILLVICYSLGWAVRATGLAPYRIGIFFFCWVSDLLVKIAEWCVYISIYFESKKDPTYEEYPSDDPDEWAEFYEYHSWLVSSGIPVPDALARQIQHIRQNLLPAQHQ